MKGEKILSVEAVEELVEAIKASRAAAAQSTLDPEFIAAMEDIGRYGAAKYKGESFQSQRDAGNRERDTPRKSREALLLHAADHLAAYGRGEFHDHFGTLHHQLAAAAFNLMMEMYFSE